MKKNIIFGFHAVIARLRHEASSIDEIYYDESRNDKRMMNFISQAKSANVRLIKANAERLFHLAGSDRHQGVVARAQTLSLAKTVDELLDAINEPPLLLILDGVTDPHNLGACLRVADSVGAHAIIAPKDKSVGINATVSKVASGAAETLPYITVTNLARTIRELKEQNIWVYGTSDQATKTIYETDFTSGVALVMGAEGQGLRRLTQETCDELISIPMFGHVESLNVSVASGICLYEARRQRLLK